MNQKKWLGVFFIYDNKGQKVDMFQEQTKAQSKEDAIKYFKKEFCSSNIQLDSVWLEQ